MRHLIGPLATSAAVLWAGAALAQGADVLLNCTSCHTLGPPTQGAPSPYPDLNGQPVRYLEAQLRAYKLGERPHPQMQATAMALGEGAAAMARMYADAPSPKLELRGNPSTDEAALTLVETGDWPRGLPSCASCHALEPKARTRLSPRLHGQPRAYLARQLRAYAEGTRQSGQLGRMQVYAEKLGPDEIEALAAYYAAFGPKTDTQSGE